MKIIEIGANDFRKGLTFDDNIENVGLSPKSKGHNYFRGKGAIMYPQPSTTTVEISGGTLTSSLVASAQNPDTTNDNEAFFVDASGKFWNYAPTTLTYKTADPVTDYGHSYSAGQCHMKVFQNKIFVTGDTDMAMLPLDMSTIDKRWLKITMGYSAGLNSNYLHPIEIIEDSLYIADVNKIHMVTYVGSEFVLTSDWMTLPDGYAVTTLCKHQDGIHMIAYCNDVFMKYDGYERRGKARAFVIDTITGEFIQEVDIKEEVDHSLNINGVNFVFYRNNFGHFDGYGLKNIRKFKNTNRMYKNLVTDINNCVVMVESESSKPSLLCFGDVNGEGNIFFSPFYQATASSVSLITAVRPDTILIAMSSSGIYEMKKVCFSDTTNVGSSMRSSRKTLSENSFVRKVEIFTETLVSNSGIDVNILDDNENDTKVGSLSYSADGAITYKRIDCNVRIKDFIFKIDWTGTSAVGFKKALIYVEPE